LDIELILTCTSSYRDPEHEEKANNFAEQEAWEKYQIGKATLKFGAVDKKNSDDYE
jgi:pre-mRNA-splicing factor ATP-dependent RNA helicase DHX16